MMTRYTGFEHLLSTMAQKYPEAPALMYEEEGLLKTLSYSALFSQVCSRRDELKAEGKTCLGILSDGSLACILTVFGSVLSGMQTVMLDENAPEELLQTQIACTDVDHLWGYDEDLIEELTPFLTNGATGSKSACEDTTTGRILFFTSGTTSSSKAAVLTDSSLMSSAWNGSSMLPLTAEDRLLSMLPLNHVFGFVCSLLWGLQCGACVAIGRGMRHYADDLLFFRPTAVSLVPLLLGFLIRQQALNPELKRILVGAGDCPSSLLEAAQAAGISVSFGYGLTETSSGVAISTTGNPFAMNICPDDTITIAGDGEILIQAPTCMMLGYYKDPETTAKVLQDGVLHTGDLGLIDESGWLHIIGRKKEILVLTDGTKIFLPEYENHIRSILGDLDFAVVEKENAPVLVLFEGHLTRRQVQEKLKPLMARYPRGQQLKDILFLTAPLPRTSTGKVRRWELQMMIKHGR